MRTLLGIVALVSVIAAMGLEVSAQGGRGIVWHRVCDIEPGQNVAAAALAREFMNLGNEGASSGPGIDFQSITAPFNQIHFLVFQPDLATWQRQSDANLANPEFQALLQKGQGVIDGDSCDDGLYRAVP